MEGHLREQFGGFPVERVIEEPIGDSGPVGTGELERVGVDDIVALRHVLWVSVGGKNALEVPFEVLSTKPVQFVTIGASMRFARENRVKMLNEVVKGLLDDFFLGLFDLVLSLTLALLFLCWRFTGW